MMDENPCLPDLTKCSCPGHRWPGVYHLVACCDEPHVPDRVDVIKIILDGKKAFERSETLDLKWEDIELRAKHIDHLKMHLDRGDVICDCDRKSDDL